MPKSKPQPFKSGDFCILSDRYGTHKAVLARVISCKGRGRYREQTLEILADDGQVAQTAAFRFAYAETCREADVYSDEAQARGYTNASSIADARRFLESFRCNRITDPGYDRLRTRADAYTRLLRHVPHAAM